MVDRETYGIVKSFCWEDPLDEDGGTVLAATARIREDG